MKRLSSYPARAVLLFTVFLEPARAYWRMGCSTVMTARMDPVIYPGAVSPHTHAIVGGSNIGIGSTYQTLSNSACTSCEIQQDKSAYWSPLLYYQYANGSFVDVHHGGSTVYYQGRGDNATTVTIPEGFRMISGNVSARAFDSTSYTWGNAAYPSRLIAEAIDFACLGAEAYAQAYSLNNTAWSPFDCYNGLRAELHFPTCWDGVNLYLSDNSHVAHLSSIDNGACPPTHPYQLPHIFLETLYSIDSVTGDTNGGRFVFAMGDPTGYGFHADFYNGWNTTVLQLAIEDDCLGYDGDGLVSSCPVLMASDTDGASVICPTKTSPINETVTGLLEKLPGCNTITDDPAGAPFASMVCPSSVTPPTVTPTADSVPQHTMQPAIGDYYPLGSFQEYIGCYNDSYDGFLALDGIQSTSESMDVETCQNYCTTAGYRLSGLEYSTECFCGNEIRNNANTEDSTVDGYPQCTWLCAATIAAENGTQEVCGGYGTISIYNNTDPAFAPPGSGSANYVGCVAEGTSGRTLQGAATSGDDMTVELCAAFAGQGNSGAGYRYYGVEYSSQCFVGNTIIPPATVLTDTSTPPSSQCNMACSGNSAEICGGSGVLSVYVNPSYTANSNVTTPIGDYVAAGCLTDSQSSVGLRALDGSAMADASMTEELCVSYCQNLGFRYAGIEYATQCYCGDKIVNGGQLVDCSDYELSACPADIHELCGGASVMNLYDSGN